MPYVLRFTASGDYEARIALASLDGNLLRQPDLKDIGFFSPAPGGDLIAPARASDGKWGYISGQGAWLVRPQFEEAKSFSDDGLARCCKDGKWGYVDLHGALCVPPLFDFAWSFHHGLAAIKNGGKWGFVGTDGAIAVEPLYNAAGDFSSTGLAPVLVDRSWGYIDRSGELIIPPKFTAAREFGPGGLAPAEVRGDKWGLINSEGAWVVAPKYYRLDAYNDDGLASFCSRIVTKRDETRKRGYLNAEGEEVFTANDNLFRDMKYSMVRDSYYNIGFYNKDGVLVIPKQFEWASNFSDVGAAIGRRDGAWGIVRLDGQFDTFGHVEPLTDAEWWIEGFDHNGLSGWITANGEIEWIDLNGQVQFRMAQTDQATRISDSRGETIWQSEASQPLRLPAPVLEAGPKQFFNNAACWEGDIVEIARELLKETPRKFSPCMLVFGDREDPYNLEEIMEELEDEGLDEDERQEELQARVRYGVLEVLAQTYVNEQQWGANYFLDSQRREAFRTVFETLKERLTVAFGAPEMERRWPGTEHRMHLHDRDLPKTACWPAAGGATLVLEWFSQCGDGEFEHQILLAALHENGHP